MIRGIATPPKSRLHPIAQIEDAESIQTSLMEVINTLVRNTIDFRRAQLILRALNIAARNAPRVHFRIPDSEMVREVPNYPAAPAAPKPAAPVEPPIVQAGALARIRRPKPVLITPPPPPPKPAAATDPARPKPPAKAKPAPAARYAASRRSG